MISHFNFVGDPILTHLNVANNIEMSIATEQMANAITGYISLLLALSDRRWKTEVEELASSFVAQLRGNYGG